MAMSRKKVLWVDDEIEFLRSHIMFLETRGYSVTPVFSGDDAIHLMRQSPDLFDIVLLDEQMPGKGGLATLAEIKEINADIPIVMVTKSEEEQLMEEAMGKKIDGYLTKPVNPSQILLVCKRILHKKEIVSSQLKYDFVRSYSWIREEIQTRLNPQQWINIYKELAKWDLELENIEDEGIRQAHAGQRSDANAVFSEFIIAHYMQWMQGGAGTPRMSPDVLDSFVIPHLKKQHPVYLVLIDSMRLDHFILVSRILRRYFTINTDFYFSILPSIAEYTRNSLLSGMFPLHIAAGDMSLWKSAKETLWDNEIFAKKLLESKLKQSGISQKNAVQFHFVSDHSPAQGVIDSLESYKNCKLITLAVDFLDKFIRGQSSSKVLQDIAPDEITFRKLFYSWFERSNIFQLLKHLSRQPCTVILTSSNGCTLCTRGTEYYGGECEMQSLRYRCGTKITCDERYAFFMHDPQRFNLPKIDDETSYIILKENYYFINHDTYQNYNEQYRNIFQHGGISLDEVIVPVAIMEPK